MNKLSLKQYESLLIGKWIPDLANTSAFLMELLPQINWVGFYLLEGDTLFLGPFQGRAACTEIKIGKGVCGSAVQRKKSIVVKDVHQFEGHIACDTRSRSEIVIPMMVDGKVKGVLDVDSPELGRFDHKEEEFLTKLVSILMAKNSSI